MGRADRPEPISLHRRYVRFQLICDLVLASKAFRTRDGVCDTRAHVPPVE